MCLLQQPNLLVQQTLFKNRHITVFFPSVHWHWVTSSFWLNRLLNWVLNRNSDNTTHCWLDDRQEGHPAYKKISHQQSQKVLLWDSIVEPSLIWSDLRKKSIIKRKPKKVVIHVRKLRSSRTDGYYWQLKLINSDEVHLQILHSCYHMLWKTAIFIGLGLKAYMHNLLTSQVQCPLKLSA